MARARNIKPGFYKNEDLAECSVWARFIFPGLWMLADRDGLLEDRPKRIKAELLPFDTQDIEPLLAELAHRKFIVRYANAQGSFIFIPGFSTHQSPHYSEKPSGIKAPPLRETGGYQEPTTPGALPERSESKPLIKRGSQPPDSLIADSLNPDSRKPPQAQAATGARDTSGDQAVAALRLLVEQDGRITLPTKGRMHLGQWATEGLSPAQLGQAIRIARGRKPHPESIPFAYLVPIVEDVKAGRAIDPDEPRGKDAIPEALRRIAAYEAREAAKAAEAGAPPNGHDHVDELPVGEWWLNPDEVMRRGSETGADVRDGEDFEDYTARVLVASGDLGKVLGALSEDMRERVQRVQR